MIKKRKFNIPKSFRYIIGGLVIMCFAPFYVAAVLFLGFFGLGFFINYLTKDKQQYTSFRSRDNSDEYTCPSYSYLPWNSNNN